MQQQSHPWSRREKTNNLFLREIPLKVLQKWSILCQFYITKNVNTREKMCERSKFYAKETLFMLEGKHGNQIKQNLIFKFNFLTNDYVKEIMSDTNRQNVDNFWLEKRKEACNWIS